MTPAAGTANSVLVFALSGLGKTTLCRLYPLVTYDTDIAFDAALALAFPALAANDRYAAWRTLARSQPWRDRTGASFRVWADTRRRFTDDILAVLSAPESRLVLTNLDFLPWPYRAYYGIELGRYEEHWRFLDRAADNEQIEASNARLEGFSPLVRVPPGRFLADDSLITGYLDVIGMLK